jgi:transaldolase/glucose-6-phosphate isomerase
MTSRSTHPLLELRAAGQSIWLDFIRRDLIENGDLRRMVDQDGLSGVTSNPSIFEKAIAGGGAYDVAIARLGAQGLSAGAIYEQLAIGDIRDAADALRPVYDETDGADGFVSLEVSPHLARDTTATIAEARRLWRAVDRPNAMIKVPGTPEGMPAIRALIGEGINVNVTLLFARRAYLAAAQAYVQGLEQWRAAGGDLRRVASVASFFVSRIDTAVDALIAATGSGALSALAGKAAIANAKLAYRSAGALQSEPRWQALAAAGARVQRLLWASTSTKNPAYRDVMYVEELVGPDTVNTLPPATLDAFRDHGRVRPSLTEDVAAAEAVLKALDDAGILLERVTDRLLDEGVKLFADSFDKLHAAVAARLGAGVTP